MSKRRLGVRPIAASPTAETMHVRSRSRGPSLTARHVVATLWPVDDWATAALMERFYGAGDVAADPGRALAEAQRTLLSAPATAHPFYWAGFVDVGGAR